MNKKSKKILIVDDEKNIVLSLNQILTESGYEVFTCDQSNKALGIIEQTNPDLLLLDVWMPGMDGLTLLKKVKKEYPKLPVIVMSGHLNAESAVDLVRLGASTFLEKPFGADMIVRKLQKVFESVGKESPSGQTVLASSFFRESQKEQKTLRSSVLTKGVGIHTGQNTGIILSPLPEDSGVVFEDISSGEMMQASVEYVFNTDYSTNLKKGDFELRVVEHLLAALHAYGITNVKVKASKEIPILDGSAKPFCELIEKAGIEKQSKKKQVLAPLKTIKYQDENDANKWIEISPYDGLSIDYELFVSKEFGSQKIDIDFSKEKDDFFSREIAPCRTFGFLDETKQLQSSGLARGANLGNGLLLHDSRVINSDLLFDNEFARHKVIDILGDFFLTGGRPLRARIVARGTGHRHNHALLKQVFHLSSKLFASKAL